MTKAQEVHGKTRSRTVSKSKVRAKMLLHQAIRNLQGMIIDRRGNYCIMDKLRESLKDILSEVGGVEWEWNKTVFEQLLASISDDLKAILEPMTDKTKLSWRKDSDTDNVNTLTIFRDFLREYILYLKKYPPMSEYNKKAITAAVTTVRQDLYNFWNRLV